MLSPLGLIQAILLLTSEFCWSEASRIKSFKINNLQQTARVRSVKYFCIAQKIQFVTSQQLQHPIPFIGKITLTMQILRISFQKKISAWKSVLLVNLKERKKFS